MASNDEPPKKKDNKQRPYLGNTQMFNELSNPCIKEQNLSRMCLEENNYDKEPCEVYFINYRNCRGFWNKVIRERRSKGLMPYLPLPEDRAEIKANQFKSTIKWFLSQSEASTLYFTLNYGVAKQLASQDFFFGNNISGKRWAQDANKIL